MATSWKSQQGDGTYRLQFETDDVGKYKLVEKSAQMAVDGKTTADVAEVVRCKDCVYGRKTNKIMSPEKYYKTDCVVCECEDVIGDEPMIYVPTHHCSYGERRDT